MPWKFTPQHPKTIEGKHVSQPNPLICNWTLLLVLSICNFPHVSAWSDERERAGRVVLVYAFWIKFNKIYCLSAAVSPPFINEWKEREKATCPVMYASSSWIQWSWFISISPSPFLYISVSLRKPISYFSFFAHLNWKT